MKASSLRRAVDRSLRQCALPLDGATLVCGLSGGADSVALLDALVALGRLRGFRVVAAHLDHRLRPGSAADAAFCAELCQRLGVPLETGRADVRGRARERRDGIEAAARSERYAFLRAVRERHAASAVAVAHTRDDQAETVLLRLLRGTGRAGLAAMRPQSGDLLRPLLCVSRRDVLDYLAERRLAWREDPSNSDRTFLRNRVRHDLLPYLEAQFNPRVRERLATTARLLADEDDLLDDLAAALFTRTARVAGDSIVFARVALTQAPRTLARRAVRMACGRVGGQRDLAAEHVERVLELAGARHASGRRLPLPGAREALVRFDDLRIGPRSAQAPPMALPLRVPSRILLPGGWTVSATPCSSEARPPTERAHVSADEAQLLMIRTRRPGDRVRVGGREISLKRFLCQRRVPCDERGRLPLVAVGTRVVCMPGQRLEPGTCGPSQVHVSLSRTEATGAPPAPVRGESA